MDSRIKTANERVTRVPRTRVGPYSIEEVIGAGGFGTVYRALAPDGTRVALKVLAAHFSGEDAARRFQREARIRIDHPNVVRVLDAGIDDDGEHYIALELLEGEPLTARLRARFTAEQVIDLGLQICAGLEAAHARGIVHRDLKPGNVFMCHDGTVKLLDFGIARAMESSPQTQLTMEGSVIGTPGWLAPEQARGGPHADARTDLWATGVLLYQAASGVQPFLRDTSVATILAVVLESPEPLRTRVPELPSELAGAIHRCLEKDREARWPNASALAAALREIDAGDGERRTVSAVPMALPADEQRVVALLLAEGVRDQPRLAAVVRDYRGELIPMLGGRAIAVFGAKAWEGDETARAVGAAHDARDAAEWMAVASGRAIGSGGTVSGEVVRSVERALSAHVDGIAVDRSSARNLIGFALEEARAGIVEVKCGPGGRRTFVPEAREVRDDLPLLGRSSEIAQIEAAVGVLVEEHRATALYIQGAIGIGKSRLRRELERRLRDHPARPRVLSGRGESHRRETLLHALGTALRSAAFDESVRDPAARRASLAQLCAHALGPVAATGVVPTLARLMGLPGDAEEDAGRPSDAQLVRDRTRLAVADTLEGLCAAEPLAIVLDDAQWSDPASLELLEELVERCADSPLLVVVVARPELRDAHADLFARGDLVTMTPRGLIPSHVAALAEAIAGRPLDDALVRAITERTSGNPLFVEQIVRELVERGQLDAHVERLPIPIDVEAAVQSRLDHLPDAEKQLCKRASVLGGSFTPAALEALGVEHATAAVAALGRRGLVAPRSRSEPDGPLREHQFRNPLFVEVAYRMNAEPARAELHRRAARYLDARDDVDPEDVARHFELAGDIATAADRYARAAIAASRRGDSHSVVRAGERALELGAADWRRFDLHIVLADASSFLGRRDQQARHLEEALRVAVTPVQRARARTEQAALHAGLGNSDRALEASADAVEVARRSGKADVLAAALARRAWALLYSGKLDEAAKAIDEASTLAPHITRETRALVAAWRAQLATARGDLGERKRAYEEAIALYREVGDVRRAASAESNLADTYNRVGAYAEAERALREALESCRRVGHRIMEGFALANLGYSLSMQGRTDEALEALDAADRIAAAVSQPRLAIAVRVYRARALLRDRPSEEARQKAEWAADEARRADMPALCASALATAALAWLEDGNATMALALARRAMELRDALGAIEEDEAELFLAYARALEANGDHAAAREVTARGRARLETLAARIADPDWRRRFLEDVPENRALYEAGA